MHLLAKSFVLIKMHGKKTTIKKKYITFVIIKISFKEYSLLGLPCSLVKFADLLFSKEVSKFFPNHAATFRKRRQPF